ncbi:MAG TPA: hypothetical protein VGA27_02165 [Candidatus Binatia bacterium]
MIRTVALVFGFVLALSIWMVWPKAGSALNSGVIAPDISGENWLNSKPLTIGGLKGRVVLVDFWTYG